jgi:hypothetical protein
MNVDVRPHQNVQHKPELLMRPRQLWHNVLRFKDYLATIFGPNQLSVKLAGISRYIAFVQEG